MFFFAHQPKIRPSPFNFWLCRSPFLIGSFHLKMEEISVILTRISKPVSSSTHQPVAQNEQDLMVF